MRLLLGRALIATLSALALAIAFDRRRTSSGSPMSRPAAAGEQQASKKAVAVFRSSPYWPPRSSIIAAAVLAILGVAAYAVYGYQIVRGREEKAARLTGGDPHRGEALLIRYGCAGCHTIPGIQRANGLVGPPLDSFSGRIYVAGMLTNTPDNLIRWIVNPRDVNPKTAMPVTGISPAEARDAAAYLYAIR
jgi:cytochrome c2